MGETCPTGPLAFFSHSSRPDRSPTRQEHGQPLWWGVVVSDSNASCRDTEGATSLANGVTAAPFATVPSQSALGRSLCPQNKTRKGRDRKKAVPRQGPFHGNHAKVCLSSRQEGSRVVVALESTLGSAGSQAGP